MSDSALQIDVENLKRVDLITVKGRIDSSNASEMDEALQGVMNDGRYNIVLDLSEVTYMSSAGLRALVSALRESKKRRGDVRIASPSERVVEVLDLAGLAPLFEIYENRTMAVGSF